MDDPPEIDRAWTASKATSPADSPNAGSRFIDVREHFQRFLDDRKGEFAERTREGYFDFLSDFADRHPGLPSATAASIPVRIRRMSRPEVKPPARIILSGATRHSETCRTLETIPISPPDSSSGRPRRQLGE